MSRHKRRRMEALRDEESDGRDREDHEDDPGYTKPKGNDDDEK